VALIRDDPIETQDGPGLIESEKSLGDHLSHGASGTKYRAIARNPENGHSIKT
jgi:hypothetical protein